MISLRRRATSTAAAVITMAALTACAGSGDDFHFASNSAYDPAGGISLESTNVSVRDLYVVAAEGSSVPELRVVLANVSSTDDALVGATAGNPAVTGRLVGGTAGAVPVPADSSAAIGNAGGTRITFGGLTAAAGTWTDVTLLFQEGRSVTGSVLVQDAVSQFSDGTVPTATPSAQADRAEHEAAITGGAAH